MKRQSVENIGRKFQILMNVLRPQSLENVSDSSARSLERPFV